MSNDDASICKARGFIRAKNDVYWEGILPVIRNYFGNIRSFVHHFNNGSELIVLTRRKRILIAYENKTINISLKKVPVYDKLDKMNTILSYEKTTAQIV